MQTTYLVVNDKYSTDPQEMTMGEFEAMCQDVFGNVPSLRWGFDKSGRVVYRDADDEIVLMQVQ